MQTEQGQPLQDTVPEVQPNLAPPPRPNVKEAYKSHVVKQLAISQIVLGCLAFILQLWDTINSSSMSVIGAGMWSGVLVRKTLIRFPSSWNSKIIILILTNFVKEAP